MGNGLRSFRMKLNPEGVLGGAAKRQERMSSMASELGIDDSVGKKKKKKKEESDGISGLRGFMDKFIKFKAAGKNE